MFVLALVPAATFRICVDQPDRIGGQASAGLCRPNQAFAGLCSQLSRGNTVGHASQFGIIRKAALYAGHEPSTVKLFWELWSKNKTEIGN
jgi:hypothetical protein